MKSISFFRLFACFATIALLSSSCEIETLSEKYEDKIVGTWEFQEVKDLKLFDNETITENYEETLFEFKPDGTLNLLDKATMSVLASGTWDMDNETSTDGETTNTYVSLETKFDDSFNGTDYSFSESTITRFKRDELCFRENKFSKNKRVELKRF